MSDFPQSKTLHEHVYGATTQFQRLVDQLALSVSQRPQVLRQPVVFPQLHDEVLQKVLQEIVDTELRFVLDDRSLRAQLRALSKAHAGSTATTKLDQRRRGLREALVHAQGESEKRLQSQFLRFHELPASHLAKNPIVLSVPSDPAYITLLKQFVAWESREPGLFGFKTPTPVFTTKNPHTNQRGKPSLPTDPPRVVPRAEPFHPPERPLAELLSQQLTARLQQVSLQSPELPFKVVVLKAPADELVASLLQKRFDGEVEFARKDAELQERLTVVEKRQKADPGHSFEKMMAGIRTEQQAWLNYFGKARVQLDEQLEQRLRQLASNSSVGVADVRLSLPSDNDYTDLVQKFVDAEVASAHGLPVPKDATIAEGGAAPSSWVGAASVGVVVAVCACVAMFAVIRRRQRHETSQSLGAEGYTALA